MEIAALIEFILVSSSLAKTMSPLLAASRFLISVCFRARKRFFEFLDFAERNFCGNVFFCVLYQHRSVFLIRSPSDYRYRTSASGDYSRVTLTRARTRAVIRGRGRSADFSIKRVPRPMRMFDRGVSGSMTRPQILSPSGCILRDLCA